MAHESVLLAIAGLSTANGEIGRFDYWLQSLLATLNEDGGRDSIEERSLIEYAVGIFSIPAFVPNFITDRKVI